MRPGEEMDRRGKDAFFTEAGHQMHGVVHVGANDGEEIPWYLRTGRVPVLAFEPNPEVFDQMVRDFAPEIEAGTVGAVNCALGERDGEMPLHLLRNLDGVTYDTKGASTFRPFPEGFRHIGWVPPSASRTLTVPVHRFDTWACHPLSTGNPPFAFDITPYDLLVIDVQGMELEVLRGFGKYLDGFRYLVVECSSEPIYDGEAPALAVCHYLRSRGFRQETPIVSHNDIMFLRVA